MRRRDTFVSTMRSLEPAVLSGHTFLNISMREISVSGFLRSICRIAFSFDVSGTGSPSIFTFLPTWSIVSDRNVSDEALLPLEWRRRIALMRAISSRNENGFEGVDSHPLAFHRRVKDKGYALGIGIVLEVVDKIHSAVFLLHGVYNYQLDSIQRHLGNLGGIRFYGYAVPFASQINLQKLADIYVVVNNKNISERRGVCHKIGRCIDFLLAK